MDKILVQFIKNDDKKTCTMLINHQVTQESHSEVPFSKFLDTRGLYLYLFSTSEGLTFDSFRFGDSEDPDTDLDDTEIKTIKIGFNYAEDPIYLKRVIRENILAEKRRSNFKFELTHKNGLS